ncbi:uncharacterized protein LOC131678765 [Topomyia yanbarensis]|uniref:uncharacterized protein LOC131678765 n=1 Tax=Topomyia yanbarensis TaxID=2498891 RepID=UPI00273B91AD|nr:uncharacterized protein LOC131678765 [Topomyia yanbarensis]
MGKEIDFISDVNERYAMIEYQLDEKLKALNQKEQTILNSDHHNPPVKKKQPMHLTPETARQRNFELLKSLEVSKARLRSRATFSPLETILQKAIEKYLKETSLIPCTTKKAYGPTYV